MEDKQIVDVAGVAFSMWYDTDFRTTAAMAAEDIEGLTLSFDEEPIKALEEAVAIYYQN